MTLFDSTGIAIQNSATVRLEYQRAFEAGVGIEKMIISTLSPPPNFPGPLLQESGGKRDGAGRGEEREEPNRQSRNDLER